MKRLDEFKDKAAVTEYLKKEKGFTTAKEVDAYLHEHLPKESYYQRKIMEAIRAAYPKAFAWKAAAGFYSQGGIPDICAVIEGRYFGFEVKRPFIGEPSKIQEQTIKKIREAGGIAGIVCFPEDARKLIEEAALCGKYFSSTATNQNAH